MFKSLAIESIYLKKKIILAFTIENANNFTEGFSNSFMRGMNEVLASSHWGQISCSRGCVEGSAVVICIGEGCWGGKGL